MYVEYVFTGVRDWYSFHRYTINFAYLEVSVWYFYACLIIVLNSCLCWGQYVLVDKFFVPNFLLVFYTFDIAFHLSLQSHKEKSLVTVEILTLVEKADLNWKL